MYLIAAIKMAVCLVEIIDDDVSQNHCVSHCSSTKLVTSSNLSQHILTRTVGFCLVLQPKIKSEFGNLLYTKISEGTSNFQSTPSCLGGTKFHSVNDLAIVHAETSIFSTTKPAISSIL